MSAALPRVSVISALYNAEAYLVETIESVLSQDCGDFELLLVDDGSSDGSTAIARGYAERHPDRISYLEHENHANRGACAARNLGLAHARGEFVAFIDADDHWRPHKLREQLAILERDRNLGAVCGTVNYWSSWSGGEDHIVPTGHVQDRPVHPPEATLLLYPLGRAVSPCPSDLMLRRSVVERIGGFEEEFKGALQLYEDQAFLSKLYLETPVYFASNIWLDYRQHDASCVAVVTRGGRYQEVRAYFLNWLEAYLRRTGHDRDPRIRKALVRATFPYRHPRINAGLVRARGAARKVLHQIGAR